MIENVLGYFELEGSDLALASRAVGEDAGTTEVMIEKVPTVRILEAGVHKAVQVDEEGKENGKAHPSNPPSIKILQALPSLKSVYSLYSTNKQS